MQEIGFSTTCDDSPLGCAPASRTTGRSPHNLTSPHRARAIQACPTPLQLFNEEDGLRHGQDVHDRERDGTSDIEGIFPDAASVTFSPAGSLPQSQGSLPCQDSALALR